MIDPRSSGGEGTESTLEGRSSDAKGFAYAQVPGLPGCLRGMKHLSAQDI